MRFRRGLRAPAGGRLELMGEVFDGFVVRTGASFSLTPMRSSMQYVFSDAPFMSARESSWSCKHG
jgi:hypothetical protein